MTVNKTKVLVAFASLVLCFSLLSLRFWGFVRDTFVVPSYYVLWVIGLVLKSIPQHAYLALLIFVCLIWAMQTLKSMQAEARSARPERNSPHSDTPYLRWKMLSAYTSSNGFFRDRFVRHMRNLVLSTLAYEQGIDSSEVEARVREGVLSVPDPIRNLIEMHNIPQIKPRGRLELGIHQVRGLILKADSTQDDEFDRFVAEIIRFMEHHLEIIHAGNYPET